MDETYLANITHLFLLWKDGTLNDQELVSTVSMETQRWVDRQKRQEQCDAAIRSYGDY